MLINTLSIYELRSAEEKYWKNAYQAHLENDSHNSAIYVRLAKACAERIRELLGTDYEKQIS